MTLLRSLQCCAYGERVSQCITRSSIALNKRLCMAFWLALRSPPFVKRWRSNCRARKLRLLSEAFCCGGLKIESLLACLNVEFLGSALGRVKRCLDSCPRFPLQQNDCASRLGH